VIDTTNAKLLVVAPRIGSPFGSADDADANKPMLLSVCLE
jgi:hypothetical protein